jgi:hypothetical protein
MSESSTSIKIELTVLNEKKSGRTLTFKVQYLSEAPVAHAYNPSYMGG